jgi:hypothetical protein
MASARARNGTSSNRVPSVFVIVVPRSRSSVGLDARFHPVDDASARLAVARAATASTSTAAKRSSSSSSSNASRRIITRDTNERVSLASLSRRARLASRPRRRRSRAPFARARRERDAACDRVTVMIGNGHPNRHFFKNSRASVVRVASVNAHRALRDATMHGTTTTN